MDDQRYTYSYPRASLTVDMIVLRKPCKDGEILLIQRLNPPFQNQWALPGGFMDMNETLEEAADRELFEETGLKNVPINQFKAYSTINRDPRGRTISVVFLGIATTDSTIKAGDDAKNARWFKVNDLPELAFDHKIIVEEAIQMLKENMKG